MSTVIFILFVLGGLMSACSFAMIVINKGKIPFGMLSLTAIIILIATALNLKFIF